MLDSGCLRAAPVVFLKLLLAIEERCVFPDNLLVPLLPFCSFARRFDTPYLAPLSTFYINFMPIIGGSFKRLRPSPLGNVFIQPDVLPRLGQFGSPPTLVISPIRPPLKDGPPYPRA